MKRLSVLILTMFIAFAANAQFDENNWTLGGVLNANKDFLSISPEIAKVVAPNQVVGLRLSFTGGDFRDNIYTVGAFYRWYKKLDNSFFPVYINFDVGGEYITNSAFDLVQFGFRPGITVPLNNRWLVNINLANATLILGDDTNFVVSANNFGGGVTFAF